MFTPTARTKKHLRYAFALLCVAAAAWWFAPRDEHAGAGERVQPPRALADFQLLDGDNQAFTRAQLQGRWSLVFFGYTHCPDVCPVTMSELAKAYTLLQHAEDAAARKAQVVFISVDPARDNPALLKSFARYFDERFIAATGTLEQLTALTDSIGARHRRLTEQGAEYRVEHSSDVWLIDPQARLYAKFPAPQQAQELARSVKIAVHTKERS
ncbi:MAG: SCO family protein [Gammaproteobacteria bacterium]|nr:SCO family protein [Gammaproteobacteria bacterium]